MKVMSRMFILCSIGFIVACGSGSDGGEKKSKFAGIWYSSKHDRYLEIKNDNEVYFRKCSVNNGYEIEDAISAFIIQDEIVQDYFGQQFIFKLNLSSDSKTLSFRDSEAVFKKKSNIPSVCINDAVDITYHAPAEVSENQLTTFVIYFDYRWTKPYLGRVRLAYTATDDGFLSIEVNDEHQISSTGVGSGVLVASIKPTLYDDGVPFIMHAILTDYSSPIIFSSVDPIRITVNRTDDSWSYFSSDNPSKADEKIKLDDLIYK